MVNLEVEVSLDSLVASLLKVTSPEFERDLLDEALAAMLNRIRTRFLSETAPDGTKWKPSKAGLKRRSSGGSGTLFDTGTLFHSIQAFNNGEPSERGIRTDVPYAKYLQKDLTGPWVFLGFGDEDLSVYEKIVLRRVLEAFNG